MNKKLLLLGLVVLTLTFNTACQRDDKPGLESEQAVEIDEEELLKLESDNIDFSKVEYKASETQRDKILEAIIVDYLKYDSEEDGEIAYYYNNVDLNEDGNEESFVYLVGDPVSGSGGSTALLVDKENKKVLSNFSLVHNPIIISKEKTNDWNNIIMQVSGGGSELSYVTLEFDGKQYPSNPSMETILDDNSVVEGIAIISNPASIDGGFELK